MTVWATTVQRGIAFAIGCGRMSLDSRSAAPPIDAIGATVMVSAAGLIVGCAALTGVITIAGPRHPITEHKDSEKIRERFALKSIDRCGPVLWVFEHGLLFGRPIAVEEGDGELWPVPQSLHNKLRSAYREARERRS